MYALIMEDIGEYKNLRDELLNNKMFDSVMMKFQHF